MNAKVALITDCFLATDKLFLACRENHHHIEIFTLQQLLPIECTYLEAEETFMDHIIHKKKSTAGT